MNNLIFEFLKKKRGIIHLNYFDDNSDFPVLQELANELESEIDNHLKAVKKTLANNYTPENIIALVSKFTDVPVENILSSSRKVKYVDARHLSIYFISEKFPKKTLEEIALFFKGKYDTGLHYSSVIYANKKVLSFYNNEKEYRKLFEQIKEELFV